MTVKGARPKPFTSEDVDLRPCTMPSDAPSITATSPGWAKAGGTLGRRLAT